MTIHYRVWTKGAQGKTPANIRQSCDSIDDVPMPYRAQIAMLMASDEEYIPGVGHKAEYGPGSDDLYFYLGGVP